MRNEEEGMEHVTASDSNERDGRGTHARGSKMGDTRALHIVWVNGNICRKTKIFLSILGKFHY